MGTLEIAGSGTAGRNIGRAVIEVVAGGRARIADLPCFDIAVAATRDYSRIITKGIAGSTIDQYVICAIITIATGVGTGIDRMAGFARLTRLNGAVAAFGRGRGRRPAGASGRTNAVGVIAIGQTVAVIVQSARAGLRAGRGMDGGVGIVTIKRASAAGRTAITVVIEIKANRRA